MKTGRVYKIITQESNEIYVGSTFNELRYRFKGHKNDYKNWKDSKTTKTQSFELFEKYGVDKCKMILIKEYPVIDRKHLDVYEALWICKLKSINKIIPFGNQIKELRKQKMKKYAKENKDRSIQYKKKYRENNRDKLKEKDKQYRKNNKRNEYFKTYREENRDRINEKVICECGCKISRNGLARHKKLNKHIKLMEKLAKN